MWSCDLEILSIPLEAHHKAQSSEIFMFSCKKLRAVIFYLLTNPSETAYLSVRDGELSNVVWLVELRRRKVAVHIFFGVVPSRAAQTAFVQELSKVITFLSYVLSW